MEAVYRYRFGPYAQTMFLQQCLLAANQYQSWHIPTGTNRIEWTLNGRNYVTRLYETYRTSIKDTEHSNNTTIYESLEDFTKALLLRKYIPPYHVLYEMLDDTQKQTFERYFYTQTDESVYPTHLFGNQSHIETLFVFQSLWLGAGYDAEDYSED